MPGPERPDETPDGVGRDVGGGPLPPPDRLWRHPSEVGFGASFDAPPAPLVATPAAPPRRRAWREATFVLGGALLGAGVALVAVLVADLRGGTTNGGAIERVEAVHAVSRVDAAALDTAISEQVLPALARVEARRNGVQVRSTGVVFRSDGHLLGSHDATVNAESITVLLADGRELDARVVGTDPITDLAVLHVEASGLATVLLGSARDLQLGEPVAAVDARGVSGAGPSVTTGVISELGATVEPSTGEALYDLIASNTGSAAASGGAAVVDASGAVIGIGTLRRPGDDAVVAVSGHRSGAPVTRHATPIEFARTVADQLIEHGSARHAWLGTECDDLTTSKATRLDVVGGAEVVSLRPDSPAGEVGLAEGDVITSIDGTAVHDRADVVVALREHAPGDEVTVTYLRAGERDTVDVTLRERPNL